MISPAQWIHTMQQGPHVARPFIVEQARLYLVAQVTADPKTRALSTTELSDALWPAAHAIGEAITLRKSMVDLLLKCAKHELSDCAARGAITGRRFMGKQVRPWFWIAPPIMGGPISSIKWPDSSTKGAYERLVDAIKMSPPGPMLTARAAGQIADVILSKADIMFKQGDSHEDHTGD